MTGRIRSHEEMASMVADPEFVAMLNHIVRGISESQHDIDVRHGMDAQTPLNVMAYLSAAILEANPGLLTNRDLRLAAEDFGTMVHQIMRNSRRMYEDTGVHILDKLGIISAKEAAND